MKEAKYEFLKYGKYGPDREKPMKSSDYGSKGSMKSPRKPMKYKESDYKRMKRGY